MFSHHPLFDAPARGNLLEFLYEIYHTEIRGIGLVKNFIILTSTFLADRTNGRVIGTVLRMSVCRRLYSL